MRRHALGTYADKFGGETTTGFLVTPRGRQKAVLIKPMEFMNLSGFAVQRAAKFHGVERDQIVAVHDEIDLDFADLRLKRGGGPGGHNGLRSMIEQLGGADFARVRCGVGKPAAQQSAGKDVSGWVLSDFPAAQAAEVDALIGRAADGVEAIVGLGITAAMNQVHAPPRPPAAPKPQG